MIGERIERFARWNEEQRRRKGRAEHIAENLLPVGAGDHLSIEQGSHKAEHHQPEQRSEQQPRRRAQLIRVDPRVPTPFPSRFPLLALRRRCLGPGEKRRPYSCHEHAGEQQHERLFRNGEEHPVEERGQHHGQGDVQQRPPQPQTGVEAPPQTDRPPTPAAAPSSNARGGARQLA